MYAKHKETFQGDVIGAKYNETQGQVGGETIPLTTLLSNFRRRPLAGRAFCALPGYAAGMYIPS
jgi:hypothetical protein